MTEQESFIAGIEFAAQYLRDNFPQDNRPDGAAFFALQIQLQANQKKAATVCKGTVMTLVEHQANDEGLWFIAQTGSEAYLQQELRRLHAAIEKQRGGV